MTAHLWQRQAQAILEQAPVRQPGQRIVVGQRADLLLALLALGDVGEDPGELVLAAELVTDLGDGQPLGIDFAALAPVPDLALPVAGLAQAPPELLVEGLVVAPGLEQRRRLTDRFFRAVAGQLGERRVDRLDDPLAIGDHDAVEGRVDHLLRQAQAALRLDQRLLAVAQQLLEMRDLIVFEQAQDVGERQQADDLLVAVGDAEMADATAHRQVARLQQAVGTVDGDQRLGRRLAGRTRDFAQGHLAYQVALGEDPGQAVLAGCDDCGVHAGGGDACRRFGQRRLRVDGQQRVVLGIGDAAHLQVALQAVIKDHVGLRDDAGEAAAAVEHQQVTDALIVKAVADVVDADLLGGGLDRRAHLRGDRPQDLVGVGEIQAQGVVLGPDAHRIAGVDHQHRAATMGAHQRRGLVQRRFGRAGQQLLVEQVTDHQWAAHSMAPGCAGGCGFGKLDPSALPDGPGRCGQGPRHTIAAGRRDGSAGAGASATAAP